MIVYNIQFSFLAVDLYVFFKYAQKFGGYDKVPINQIKKELPDMVPTMTMYM